MKSNNMPIRKTMSISQSMSQLYDVFEKLEGPIEAKELLVALLQNSLSDIHDEGLKVTPEEIERRLLSSINDYLEVAKKTNVA
jgi:hypothetical protein